MPRVLTELLVARGGPVRLGEPLRELPEGVPVVLATGGFQGDRSLVREHVTPEADHLLLRANPWSCGDGLRLGLAAGASLSEGLGEFYGRNMPAPPAVVRTEDFVPLAQLYARHARVESSQRRDVRHPDLVRDRCGAVDGATAGRARLLRRARDAALAEPVRERSVGDMIEAAEQAGARVVRRRRDDQSGGGGRDHHHARWPADRLVALAPPRACSPPARTPAGSPPAATRAALPPRWCSA